MTVGEFGRGAIGDFGRPKRPLAPPAPQPTPAAADWRTIWAACIAHLPDRKARAPAALPPRKLPLGLNMTFFDARDALAAELRRGTVAPNAAALVDHVIAAGCTERAVAAEFVERFLASLRRDLERRQRVTRHGASHPP